MTDENPSKDNREKYLRLVGTYVTEKYSQGEMPGFVAEAILTFLEQKAPRTSSEAIGRIVGADFSQVITKPKQGDRK